MINKDTLKELLENGVLEKWLNGEKIELLVSSGKWVELENPSFNYPSHCYRIKSEYREVTDSDIGKVIEVSNDEKNWKMRKLVFIHKFTMKTLYYCENIFNPERVTPWNFARDTKR